MENQKLFWHHTESELKAQYNYYESFPHRTGEEATELSNTSLDVY